MSGPLRLGVLGTGRIASDYLASVDELPDVVAVGLCDVVTERARALGERWSVSVQPDPEALVQEAGAEAVLIATPPVSHEELSLRCLAAGAHVLCEKPLALSAASGRRMLGAADEAGLVLTMSAKFRHVPDVIEAKARLGTAQLGRLVRVEQCFVSPVAMAGRWNADPEVAGGGVLIDNGTHSVDLLRYLCGPPDFVEAVEGPRLQGLPVEDTVHVLLGHPGGLVATVDLSWSLPARTGPYLVLHGEHGSLELGWQGSLLRRGDGGSVAWGRGYRKVEALGRQLRHFARVVRGTEPPLLGRADLLAGIEVVEAAYLSLAEGRRVRLGR
ncbi:MAG: Gfo/Idh/MocA family oxidoreductase [Planctomycetota bacterium]